MPYCHYMLLLQNLYPQKRGYVMHLLTLKKVFDFIDRPKLFVQT